MQTIYIFPKASIFRVLVWAGGLSKNCLRDEFFLISVFVSFFAKKKKKPGGEEKRGIIF